MMTSKLFRVRALPLLAAGLLAACDGEDPIAPGCERAPHQETCIGAILDMAVDAKVAGGIPSLSVDRITRTSNSPSAMTISLRYLDPVQGAARYQLFLATLDGSKIVPLRGDYTKVQSDTVRVNRDSIAVTVTRTAVGKATGTQGGAINITHEFQVAEADQAPNLLDDFAYVVVTVQPEGEFSASAPAPLFFKYRDEKRAPNLASAWLTGDASFGRFAPGGESYLYAAGGQGLGGFFNDRLVVNLRRLPRPPLGYAYRAWMVGGGGAEIGPITAPYPELTPLDDADVAAASPVVQAREIVDSTVRTSEGQIGAPFHTFDAFIVTLELKAGAPGRGFASVIGADLPGSILSRRAQ